MDSVRPAFDQIICVDFIATDGQAVERMARKLLKELMQQENM